MSIKIPKTLSQTGVWNLVKSLRRLIFKKTLPLSTFLKITTKKVKNMYNTTITINRETKSILVQRINTRKSNNPDTRYLNLTKKTKEQLDYYQRRGFEMNVEFIQYLTKEDKKKDRPYFKITKSVKKLISLGLRTRTKSGKEFFRNKLVEIEVEVINISKPIIPAQITTGSICSGIGASEESMKQNGFDETNHRNLFMCEWDDKVSDIYKQNFKSENYFKDFYKADWSKVKNHHLHILFISTPCQEFSIASGQRKGLDSEKGQLYIDALIKARELSPDKIINENVSTIISSGRHYSKVKKEDGSIEELNYIPNEKQLKKENLVLLESQKDKYVYKSKINPSLTIGRTLKTTEDMLLNDFKDYNIYMDILNTRDFETTPQNRKRFFLVMIKKSLDYGFKYPTPKPLKTKVIDLLDNVEDIDDSLIINDRDIVKYNKEEPENPKQLHEYGVVLNKDGSFPKHRASSVILYPSVSACLTTTGHTKIYDPRIKKVRYLSLREQARLHNFGEDFIITNNYKLGSHVMGNTLSPSVMKELIKGVLFFDKVSQPNMTQVPTTSGNNTNYTNTKAA